MQEEEFKESYAFIDNQRSHGIISEQEYLDKLTVLNDKYNKNNRDTWLKYDEEVAEGKKKLWESQAKMQGEVYSKAIDEQIDKLKEEKKAEQEYYDEQIEHLNDKKQALQEEYTEQDKLREIEERRQALVKAETQRTNLILKDGEFDYYADEGAVKDAQDGFNDANRDFEKYNIEKSLDNQIKSYEDAKKAAEDSIDSQIEDWEMLKDRVQEQISQIGANIEENALQTDMLNSVNKLLGDTTVSAYDEMSDAVTNYVDTFIAKMDEMKAYKEAQREAQRNANKGEKSVVDVSKIPKYASGTNYAKGGLSIVDDDINSNVPEIILPPLEKGRYVDLGAGSRVLTSSVSEAFIRLMQNPATMLQRNMEIISPKINTDIVTPRGNTPPAPITLTGDLSFPNVRSGDDAEQFLRGLRHLTSDAMQAAYRR